MVRVEPVSTAAQRLAFASLARSLHPRDCPWVRPLDAAITRLVDPAENPMFRDAAGQALIAWDGDAPVGRVHVHVSPRHATLHRQAAAFFGLLETRDDGPTCASLMAAAEAFARARGAQALRGPYNLAVTNEGGLVVSGHQNAPAFGMAWSPPSYYSHLARLGYTVYRRARTWKNDDLSRPLAVPHRGPEELGVAVRHSSRRRLRADVAEAREVMNGGFLGAKDFVPFTAEEWEFLMGPLVPFLDPALVIIAEAHGAMVGVSLAVPDFNRILARLDGHTWHPEAAAFFRSPPADEAVFLLSALHLAWQGQGVGRLLNAGLLYQARRRGYRALAGTWIDEDNVANRRQVEALGMRPWHELVVVQRALA